MRSPFPLKHSDNLDFIFLYMATFLSGHFSSPIYVCSNQLAKMASASIVASRHEKAGDLSGSLECNNNNKRNLYLHICSTLLFNWKSSITNIISDY